MGFINFYSLLRTIMDQRVYSPIGYLVGILHDGDQLALTFKGLEQVDVVVKEEAGKSSKYYLDALHHKLERIRNEQIINHTPSVSSGG